MEPLSPSRSPLFHNKHRYQKIGVHEVAAADGQRYNVLYLATGGEGTRSGGTFPAWGDIPRGGSGAGAAFPAWHMLVRQERAAAFWEQLKAASLPAWALGTIPGTGERGTALPRCGLDCCGAQILSKGAAPSFSGASRVVLIPPVRGVCSLGGTCRDLNS